MKNIYTIRDRVANDIVGNQMYALLLFRVDIQAVRYFGDALADKTSILAKHPADYELIRCGAIDDDGTIQHLKTPELIITGDNLLAARTLDIQRNEEPGER